MNKAVYGSKESAAPNDELETWKETVLLPTLARYSPNDIYNGYETVLFYKLLPTGLIASMLTSLQALQNIKTD